MTVIVINDDPLFKKFNRLAAGMTDMTTLGNAIAASLSAVTEDNFEAEGRPKWAGLSASYEKRKKGGKILFASGDLRRRIETSVNAKEVVIGTNLVYAAIHQFGGSPRRGLYGYIKARPYLPFTAEHGLQYEAREAIDDDVDFYINKLMI